MPELTRMSDFDLAVLLDAAREELFQLNLSCVTYFGARGSIKRHIREAKQRAAGYGHYLDLLTKADAKLDEFEQKILAQKSFVQHLENELRSRSWHDAVRGAK